MINQKILERLTLHEQKIAQLDELAKFRDEFGARIQTLESLLKEMHEHQQGRFSKVEADLERTCQHLQSYLDNKTIVQAKAPPVAAVKAPSPAPRKGLLSKLFS